MTHVWKPEYHAVIGPELGYYDLFPLPGQS